MSQIRKWCYYDENEPFKKISFNTANNDVEQAFMSFLEDKSKNKVSINGFNFDFVKMECSVGGKTYKVSSNGGCVPYRVCLGDTTGVPANDQEALSKLDPSKVVYRWLWWDNPGGVDPFSTFKAQADKNPMWTHYSPSDERTLETLYGKYKTTNAPQRINNMFCVRFDCTYEFTNKVIIQGRNDDENNAKMPEPQKRRRPIIRAAYCWCWDSSDGTGMPTWTPYERDISVLLEEAYIAMKSEVDIKVGSETFTVNVVQNVQFNIKDTYKKHRVIRFGTEFIKSFKDSLGGKGGVSANDMVPQYWQDQEDKQFVLSPKISPGEFSFMSSLINNFQQAKLSGSGSQIYTITPSTCDRIQNIAILKTYFAKKNVISGKRAIISQSPQVSPLLKDAKAVLDGGINELYLWHYASNFEDIKRGRHLTQPFDANARGSRGEMAIRFSDNIGYEDALNRASFDGTYSLLLCRVILDIMGLNQPISGINSQEDFKYRPPSNPSTGKPYDSVLFTEKDMTGKDFVRFAIYDIGQIYPEYVVNYKRTSGQQQFQPAPQQTLSQNGGFGPFNQPRPAVPQNAGFGQPQQQQPQNGGFDQFNQPRPTVPQNAGFGQPQQTSSQNGGSGQPQQQQPQNGGSDQPQQTSSQNGGFGQPQQQQPQNGGFGQFQQQPQFAGFGQFQQQSQFAGFGQFQQQPQFAGFGQFQQQPQFAGFGQFQPQMTPSQFGGFNNFGGFNGYNGFNQSTNVTRYDQSYQQNSQ